MNAHLTRLLASPLLTMALVALAAALWWHARADATHPAARPAAPSTARIHDVSVADARLGLPVTWRQIDRGERHATWQSPAANATVTLASTEASGASLLHVVTTAATSVADSFDAQLVAGPIPLDIPHGAHSHRGDSALLIRFQLPRGAARSRTITQVWRRDSRASMDVVATWTGPDSGSMARELLPWSASNG